MLNRTQSESNSIDREKVNQILFDTLECISKATLQQEQTKKTDLKLIHTKGQHRTDRFGINFNIEKDDKSDYSYLSDHSLI